MAVTSCKATSGISPICTDLLRSGGADRTFWVGYLSELATQFDLTQTADINTISFASYGCLRRFDGNKFSHSFGSEKITAAGGNVSFKQTFAAKLLSTSTATDLTLQQLALAQDAFIIAQNNNNEFFILGAGKGMFTPTDVQNTGVEGNSDIYDAIAFEADERTKPLRFAKGAGYSATVAYLTSVQC